MTRREFLRSGAVGGVCALFDARLFAAASDGGAQTLLLGGTAFALGAALAHPRRTVVLERGIHLAPEFSLTGDWAEPGVPTTPLGRELASALQKSGLITDGKLELSPLSDFLQGFFADHGGAAFFNAELVACTPRAQNDVQADVYGGGSAGVATFAFRRILDTTDVGWRNRGLPDVAAKKFSAITSRGLFSVELPPSAGWRDARLALHDAFAARGGDARFLAENNAIRCLYRVHGGVLSRTFPDGTAWVPSAQFPTFIRAFEEGLQWNLA